MKSKELVKELKEIYNNLNNEEVLHKAVKMLGSKDFQNLKLSLFKDLDNTIDDESMKLLKYILKICNYIYNNTSYGTGLTDSEYDILLSHYQNITGNNIITEPIMNTDSTGNHTYTSLRGTLDKIYKITDDDVVKNKSQSTLDDWIIKTQNRYKDKTGEDINLLDEEVYIMPKFDGISCVFECDESGRVIKALTRGDTERNIANDITPLLKDAFISHNCKGTKHGVKTEIMMTDDNLERYNKDHDTDYKNTRSIVAAILNSKNSTKEDIEYLTIVPLRYSYIESGKESLQYIPVEFLEYPHIECKLSEIDKIHEFALSHKSVYPGLRCDGCVIILSDTNLQKILGRDNDINKYEVAFKYTEEIGYSKVKDIEFTTGLFGRLSPVVVFKDIKLKGNTINKASLGSYKRFKELELCKGDVVKVIYDIVPYIEYDDNDPSCSRSGNKPIKAPDNCPECNEPLELEDDDNGELNILRCTNKNCPCRIRGKILNFCQKMDIGNISYSTISDLYNEGLLRSIQDLYKLWDYTIAMKTIDGFDDKRIDSILSEIENHMEVDLPTVIGAIGIEGFSLKKFRVIFDYISLYELIKYSKENNIYVFMSIPGIKEKSAQKLIDGVLENLELIEFIKTNFIIKKSKKSKNNFTVCFTKVREDDEPGLKEFIENNGGVIDNDSFTKKTDILVIPYEGVISSKVDKAVKYNIPIVTIDKLKEYITNNFK